jgi:hypothetical protein
MHDEPGLNKTLLCLAMSAGALVMASTPFSALAQQAPPAGSALDSIYSCADLTDPAARLACYDAAVARVRADEASGALIALDQPRAEAVRREAFGFSVPSLFRLRRPSPVTSPGAAPTVSATPAIAATPEEDSQTFSIVRVAQRPSGTVITTESGQVWALLDPRTLEGRASPPFQVRIRRATLGSFIMQVEGRNRGYRVRRVE